MFNSSCKKEADGNLIVTDIDGNVYHTVTIGTQVWMLENLETNRYLNGDSIPKIVGINDWSNQTAGAQCIYNNNPELRYSYGRLYNWYAVNDLRKIAPTGWHVPGDAEWTILENYLVNHLGYSGSSAKAIAAITNWTKFSEIDVVGNDLSKNNSSGFTALPGGNRYSIGEFDDVGDVGCWWSSTEGNTSVAWSRGIYFYYSTISRNGSNKACGLSVRCIKD
jgi:uncharacterized protein (TIGR02145 family)